MDKLYLTIAVFVAIVVIVVASLDYVFADPIIHIELKDTLTMTDKVILND